MSREIKFRAWKESEGKLLSWYELCDFRLVEGINLSDILSGTYLKAVMQYTGLKDKNGKEIYEGDIIDYPIFGIHVVEWNEDLAGWAFNDKVKGVDWEDSLDREKIEIIGNIYENPELLEGN